ncbi:hypothetical protein ACFFQW_19580 [Umezawaea endophytica]|uniref:Uncharacterized protein n=1 Tax=Umezawaea endophytica TaxID=1654476 RepID=A0A9X3A1F9_9PSEU|nr:hypothetical protein [Umezawaea endophytica]MCS7479609.1 hypothetical protein [Umezawaea endophytica]
MGVLLVRWWTEPGARVEVWSLGGAEGGYVVRGRLMAWSRG